MPIYNEMDRDLSRGERNVEFDRIDTVMAVMGQFDENVRLLEERLSVKVLLRDSAISVSGDEFMADRAVQVLRQLGDMALRGEEVTRQQVIHILNMAVEDRLDEIGDHKDAVICTTVKGRQIKAKTQGQRNYVKAVSDNTITFCIGPAGTGKTYLAVALAVNAFKNKIADRIILTRPAVEAGEKLGFLPGDLQNKVDPYLRPLYDALYETMGAESYQRYFDKGMIEIAPLAYMRGRTLDNSFIILDEAQNTTFEQMKMFLTRIGFGSKVVVTGDITQVDLPSDKKSGLREVIRVINHIDDISFIYLTEKDVVRHELVRKIIKAYEDYERTRKKRPEAGRRRP
ncbi:MAG: PhoH family protein [Clostridiales bacterium]|jgi:phosphate starvation-inducible PhoH-like protein|nr:PhoH family protein [Clostridiales bacterium]